MEYRNLGKSGLRVSEFSFGSWITFGNQIGDNTSEELLKMAYDAGVNFFDNAEVYANGQSEIVMGEILKKMGWDRDSYIVSSKVYFGKGGHLPTQKGLNRKHVVEACDAALQRLQVDYLDLYFCHRPDKSVPMAETVWTMHNLIQQGKILYWGISEWSAQEIMEAHMVAERYNLIGPTMEQPQYNMLHRDKVEVEFKQIYKTVGLGTTIWSPLASGVLTGKYSKGIPSDSRLNREELSWLKDQRVVDETLSKVDKMVAFANDELGISGHHLALLWCWKNPNVSTVILGASKTSQLEDNLKVLELKDKITDDVMAKVEEILDNAPEHPMW
ncbi:potassium channel beta subunit family protein [Phaeocystidibacter luteus]|uniref:Aldo/keto reductase n=1 Tax=Phaeocystidibacter luteus TaxID=911197 RepID=A0A6N6RHS6_9FLAO|nr:aldo/keto reductase [Phaeocystidibacter luteus]KAB2813895.1 aldo/keto reductase [Phaeocystidibacter luteus]